MLVVFVCARTSTARIRRHADKEHNQQGPNHRRQTNLCMLVNFFSWLCLRACLCLAAYTCARDLLWILDIKHTGAHTHTHTHTHMQTFIKSSHHVPWPWWEIPTCDVYMQSTAPRRRLHACVRPTTLCPFCGLGHWRVCIRVTVLPVHVRCTCSTLYSAGYWWCWYSCRIVLTHLNVCSVQYQRFIDVADSIISIISTPEM